ncbi:MAG: pilus assembly protein PilM, partial [Pirellulaceae bacterium]|nr:pilus assembly protein PilM [Pirellulaceae bacterium]
MAKKPNYVWGIDIGQCGLKALRCLEEDGQVVADAFDYIEYPKILSQPEADPEALVQEALEQFLSRNEVVDAKVAISVPGQSGLAKFFKPPPVDVKRIPDIVQYEAKQQIPFALEEVIWDFQQMAGGTEVDGFAIDTEVGLFAMKREQVFRYLQPFDKAEIELDIVQLAPLSIYNFVSYDILSDGPDPDEFDPDEPPESIVILAMGTDATDLVITNGFRVWQRSIPLGGNHFTKQLTKELKLTFAKAEHLKRNARQAEDPKAVFQAMRPIFNDLVTEVQRSIGFFQGIDRKAKIRGVVLLGNTVKLPGLQQYVAKNLGYEVIEFEKYNLLGGPSVVSSPAFTDNVLAFGVSYGLCLQGLKKARLLTSLLPREITTARIVRAKKPWAIASLSTLMLACAFSFVFTYSVWSEVQENAATNGVTWEAAEAEMAGHKTTSDGFKAEHENQVAKLKFMAQVGEEVVGSGDRRIQWLELMKAITAALPVTQDMPVGEYVSHKDKPLDERQELYIGHIESEYFPDLSTWWANNQVQVKNYELMAFLKKRFPIAEPVVGDNDVAGADTGDSDSSDTMDELDTLDEQDTLGEQDGSDSGGARLDLPGPTGPGWIIEIEGYHYFNKSLSLGGA